MNEVKITVRPSKVKTLYAKDAKLGQAVKWCSQWYAVTSTEGMVMSLHTPQVAGYNTGNLMTIGTTAPVEAIADIREIVLGGDASCDVPF